MPWKNGGGTTIEIGKYHPEGEPNYLWRASNAHVASSGPFSDFTGYDRILLYLAGGGLRLHFTKTDQVITLNSPLTQQHRFAGEEPCHCELVDPSHPVSDWNFIWRRDRGVGDIRIIQDSLGSSEEF